MVPPVSNTDVGEVVNLLVAHGKRWQAVHSQALQWRKILTTAGLGQGAQYCLLNFLYKIFILGVLC